MQRCAFTPYEGKKPYIFISYAHKDSHLVFPVLEELDRRGYRVWYDDGIAPGSEWPENIAQHLDGCSLTMAFISPNSIASANCRREVTFALSKRKPFLGILLQPTEMSLGMEMQLSAQQCIMKYTYPSEEDFFRKVCACPDMQPCLGEPKAVPVAAAPVAPAAAPVKAMPQTPKEKKPLDKKLISILAGVAAAVVVLAIVLGIVLGGGKDGGDKNLDQNSKPQTTQTGTTAQKPSQGETTLPEDTEPENTEPEDTEPEETEPEESETWLYYWDQVITAKDVEYINKQHSLEVLEINNCIVQNGAFDALSLPVAIIELRIENTVGVTNLHSLAGLNNLEWLRLINCGITDADVSKLSSQVLCDVDISGNPEFGKLEILEDCTAIEYLNFSNTAVSSLDALKKMENLDMVNGSYTQVKDLTVLANMTTLREVYFAGCGMATIGGVFYSLHLEKLDLSYNELTSLEDFTYCTTLETVNVSFNCLEDAEVLGKSAESLHTLNLAGNTELYYFNLDFLKECGSLVRLTMDGIYLVDLSLLSGARNLGYLSAVDCHIMDIAGLSNVGTLYYLNLSCNRIDDISVLADVCEEGMRLDLSFNDGIEDVSALPEIGYAYLNLTNIYLDPNTIGEIFAEKLALTYSDVLKESTCLDETKNARFDSIYIVDCPMDKIVSMEKRFGEYRTHFLQELDEYLAFLEEQEIDYAYLKIALS